MSAEFKKPKNVFSIRIPPAVNEKLVERAETIGISKNAVILNILHKEFSADKNERQQVRE